LRVTSEKSTFFDDDSVLRYKVNVNDAHRTAPLLLLLSLQRKCLRWHSRGGGPFM